jgi:tetratricopeptide (TPR) repeat protein
MGKRMEHKHHPSLMKNPQKAELAANIDRLKWAALAVILLVSFAAYLPIFHNGLLAWDDNAYIRDNVLIHSINLKDIFSHYVVSNWHPITILTLALEYQFFGLNATGYHSVNLLLHLLNVILVFYSIYLLTDKVIVALVASLLFGIHPLHVESVAWAAELKDLLYTFFFLASYIFYLKYLKELQNKHQPITKLAHQPISTSAHQPIITSSHQHIIKSSHLHIFTSSNFYVFALLLFTVSLLSKAMAASLPLVLILTDYFKGRKINIKTVLEKVPFFLLAIAIGVVAVSAQKSSGTTNLSTILSIPQRIVFASYGFISYLFKLLFPLNLSAFYPYPVRNGVDIPIQYYAYFLLFLGLAAYTIYSHRFTKKIIFGIGFFTITVLLVLQLLPVGNAIMADRYSYLPSIGIFYLAGEGFIFMWSKKLKIPAFLMLSLFAVLFSVKTYARCGVWKNDMTLWNDVIDQDKTAELAYYNRGVVFKNEKRYIEAINDFNKAIELQPFYSEAYNNRGIIFSGEKRNDMAIKDFNKAIELKPDNAQAYNNRGLLLMNEKRNDEALKDFNKTIELKPDQAEPYNNRGTVLINENRNEEAIKDFKKAIELKPDYAEAYYNRGNAFAKIRTNAEAISDFTNAIKLKSDYIAAYNNRGIVFVNEKRNEEAIKDFTRVIQLNPLNWNAYYNRGMVFENMKRNDDAIKDFNKAIELKNQSESAKR